MQFQYQTKEIGRAYTKFHIVSFYGQDGALIAKASYNYADKTYEADDKDNIIGRFIESNREYEDELDA
jgi:hypothetical protein